MTMLNDKEYDLALARLNEIFDAEPGTPEAEELEALATSIEEYEAQHYPIDPPMPEEAAKFRAQARAA